MPHTKSSKFCAHPKNQSWEIFLGCFCTQKTYSCGGRVPLNNFQDLAYNKKVFWDFSKDRPTYWSTNQHLKDNTLKGIFWVKIAPTSKKEGFFSPLMQERGLENWKKSIFEWKFSSFFSDYPNKAKSKRKKFEKTSGIKWNSWCKKRRWCLWVQKSPHKFFFEKPWSQNKLREEEHGSYRSQPLKFGNLF